MTCPSIEERTDRAGLNFAREVSKQRYARMRGKRAVARSSRFVFRERKLLHHIGAARHVAIHVHAGGIYFRINGQIPWPGIRYS
jgi:hypothetical protein